MALDLSGSRLRGCAAHLGFDLGIWLPCNTVILLSTSGVGPTKQLRPILAAPIGVRRGDLLHDDWTTHFSPVYAVFDHWWTSPDGSRESLVRWHLYICLVAVDENTTQAVSITYARSLYPGPAGCLRLFRWLMRRKIDEEIRADVGMLHHLADYDPGIDGSEAEPLRQGAWPDQGANPVDLPRTAR